MSKTECLFRIRLKNLPQCRVKSDRAKRTNRARENDEYLKARMEEIRKAVKP